MTRALVTQMLEAMEPVSAYGLPGTKDVQQAKLQEAITAAREYLATEPKPTLKEALAQQGIKLRKALDAEITQSVEPYAVFQGLVDSGEHGAFNLDLLKMIPRGAYLYLHPPQPQATTPAVPEGYVLVPVEPTPAMCAEGLEDEGLTIKDGFKYAYALYTCMVKTAQGEKP